MEAVFGCTEQEFSFIVSIIVFIANHGLVVEVVKVRGKNTFDWIKKQIFNLDQ